LVGEKALGKCSKVALWGVGKTGVVQEKDDKGSHGVGGETGSKRLKFAKMFGRSRKKGGGISTIPMVLEKTNVRLFQA